ncbi:MAG: T9SS type A sorting domain-containing protein [Saprospiraceae bacterium]|nr:T9SS type A sorting domain-containing protein [Saprospiraceae bacterium]
MKLFFYAFTIFFSIQIIHTLNAQDTVWVQTLTWDSTSRHGVWDFPDQPGQSYRKVLMYYNMRCHNAAVGNGNVGCYEWDYSCNTFVTDSSKIDSSAAVQNNYDIRGFTGHTFEYRLNQTYSYYQYLQKRVSFNSTNIQAKAKMGNSDSHFAFDAKEGVYRGQFLFGPTELLAAGLRAGNISAIEWPVSTGGADLTHFRIRIKAINQTEIKPTAPHVDGWTEVYYLDTKFDKVESKILNFYKTFNWNGTSSLLMDVSFTKPNKAAEPEFGWQKLSNNLMSIGTHKEQKSIVWDGVGANLQDGKLAGISEELSISFWAYGTAHFQPSNGSILEGMDANGQRSLNIHLPWSNGTIYFDCGFEAGSYDRIEKAASLNEYEANWNHWTFTKNSKTGIMRIYKNARLWMSGTGKLKNTQLKSLRIGEGLSYDGPFYGRMRDLSIWKTELDSVTIQEWMHKSIDASHPKHNDLLFNFDMQESAGDYLKDLAVPTQDALLSYPLIRHSERADKLLTAFNSSEYRPSVAFIISTYSGFRVDDEAVLDSIYKGPSRIREYRVENNELILDSTYWLFKSGDEEVYNEAGEIPDFIYLDPDGALPINSLKYFRKFPSKYELLSLVTPYGNGLDLGKAGKTFVFDVTDFTPILKGKKLMSVEFGAWQEELDIKFAFIKGTPEREVLDISNIWPFDRGYFNEINNNTKFEPRELTLAQNAKFHEVRMTVTGHEQNGEFTPKKHFITAAGTRKYQFDVWKECGSNPIYPQGGTWIFDRAGWCPGAATDLHRMNITDQVGLNKKILLDYGIELPVLSQANYLVSSQIVSYGPYAYKSDVALEEIMRPSSGRVEFDRLNPSCSEPIIQIRNSGSDVLQSCVIQYGKKGQALHTYTWNGSLNPSSTLQINLPIPFDGYLGNDTSGVFEVSLSSPNGQNDENISNNLMSTTYKLVDKYGSNLHFEFKTNTVPADNSYRIVNASGVTVIERNSMTANTTYREELNLPSGCYSIFVNDRSHDGLYFWFYSNLGSGFARLSRKVNTSYAPLKTFNPDFGAGFQYDFQIESQVATKDEWVPRLISIAPNPAHDQLEISIVGTGSGEMTLELINASGVTVKKEILEDRENGQSQQWNISELPKGIYLLRIGKKGSFVTRKVFIQ